MITKAVWINAELHRAAKLYSFRAEETLSGIFEKSIIEYMGKNPINDGIVPAQITISRKAVGRPSLKKPYKFGRLELKMMEFGNQIPKFPESDQAPLMGTITLKYRQDGLWIFPDPAEDKLAAYFLIDVAFQENAININDFPVIQPFDGLEALVIINKDYTPANELATMILGLTPGRTHYSNYLLFAMAKIGFEIRYQ